MPANNGIDFFNVDGTGITLNTIDSSIQNQNYYVSKSEEICQGTIQQTSYYFIENKTKSITTITFAAINKSDKVFEREFVGLSLMEKFQIQLRSLYKLTA